MSQARSALGISETARSLLAGAVASATYLAALHGLTMPAWQPAYALTLALGSFVGVSLLLPRRASLTEQLSTLNDDWDGDASGAADVIATCRARIERLRAAGESLDGTLRERTDGVISGAERIVDGFVEDPRDIRHSATFERYLGAAADIAEKCADLDDKTDSDAVQAVLTRSDNALSDIETAFGRQYERNLSNDILDLDVDLDVLTQTIKSEEPRP